jgi:hypothetical protein
VASKQRWHASCAGSPHKRAAAPLCIPCERCRAGFETSETTRICADPERQKRIKDGRHVGLDFYDLLIEVTMRKSYGFRTFRCLELALYHSLGKLPEPESTHDFF